jgi:outer membrane protein assembly factor BamA
MTKLRPTLLTLLLLPALHLVGMAQSSPSKSFDQLSAAERKLIAINVTGSKRYSPDEIAAATGLQIGTTLIEDDLKRASVHLGDTGAFSDIAYHYSYSDEGTKVEFQVTDTHDFVPARFEDFVWFTDADLRQQIKNHVPLFEGELPMSGQMADNVSDVLQAMLVEGGIPGHVDYQRVGKQDGPVEAIKYQVSDVLIRVRNIEFTGAGEAELPVLKAAAENMPDREYSRSRLNLFVQHQLLPIYHARGYLKAAFGDPQPKAVKLPANENSSATDEVGPRNQTFVDVTFAVTPGKQYKLKSLSWSGNRAFPTDELAKLVHAELSQPANTIRLGDDLKSVQKLYGSRGFITAALKGDAEFDDAAGTVAMTIDVKEGSVYHMGDLEFRGLDNSLTAKLREAWKLRPGDVYDATYLDEYLPAAQKLLPTRFDWGVSSHVTANLRDKTVDVDLIYSVRAPK